jgi:hypothetical protein
MLLAALLLPAAWAQSPEAFTPGDETPEQFPEGAGRDETFYACTACHNFKLVAAQGLDRERWSGTLDFMTARHNMPAIEGDERKLILDYLATTYPPRPAGGGWKSPFAPR